jgi:crotonobetainyl-CoA:carnitine CoA-transferase CaiB-like acyl-CoA transferase
VTSVVTEEPPSLLVVDVSRGRAGGLCSKLLAMGGADVITLSSEEFAGMDGTTSTRDAIVNEYFNAFKVGAVVDPRQVHDRELMDAALAAADVVVSSFEGGRFHLGIEEKEVRRINPTVIHATISPFGTTGPYAGWKSSALVDWAASGYLFVTGDPGREPLSGPEGICEAVCGYTVAMAIEAALAARRLTGGGHFIEASVMESMLCAHQSTFSRHAAGIVMGRTGNEIATCYPLGVKQCRDGHILLSVVTDQDFDRLAIAMGAPHLVADSRFGDGSSRYRHREALDAMLDPWLDSMTGEEIAGLLQGQGVVASKVVTTRDLLSDVQLQFRDFFDGFSLDGQVRVQMPGNPVSAREGPRLPFRRAPQGRGDPDGVRRLAGAARREGRTYPAVTPVSAPPFSGRGRSLTVLDATIWWAGPLASRFLADLGARVIRVERPAGRDDTYHDSGVYVTHKLHRGKESLAVDGRTAEGRAIVHRLVALADVFVENFRPGVMAKLGLDYPTLAAINPELVYVSLNGFGSDGPHSSWGSHGTLIEAASSVESRTGYVDGEPMKLGHPLPDAVGGIAGALAALRGLRGLAETGRGAYFDISQLESYCAAGGDAVLETSASGIPAHSLGNGAAMWAPQNVYACRGTDQWVALSVCDDAQWSSMRGILLHASGLSSDDRAFLGEASLGTFEGRRERRSDIDAVITRWTAGLDKELVAEVLQAKGIAAFPVMTSDDLVHDPQVRARGVLVDVRFGDEVKRLPGVPVRTAEPLFDPRGVAPRLGEHTRAILRSDLGFDEEHIDALVRRGTVATG